MPAVRPLQTLAVLALTGTLAGAAPAQTAPEAPAAYLDDGARRLVERARARRETLDRSIRSYTASMTERIGAGVRALRRDRMLFHRELALRITWRRDTVGTVEVVGARQGVPIATRGVEVPDDLAGDVADYAFDPASNRMAIGSDSAFIVHPLAPGSEAHYRFAAGDSTVLTFPDGRRLRLFELRVIPRRLDARLLTGALWIEGDGFGVVRLLSRLARPFDFDIDVQRRSRSPDSTAGGDTTGGGDPRTRARRDGDGDDIPGFLKPIRADVRFFAIEYALWQDRWWLPRLVSFDGVATVGSWAQFPLRYELAYDDYEVTGDSAAVAEAPLPPVPNDTARARCRERWGEEVECRCRAGRCFALAVTIPPDTAALLASAALPPGFRSPSDSMVSEREIADLAAQIGALPPVPWQAVPRPPRWGLARYNRVEALSLGARGEVDFGRLQLDALARVGVADLVPNAELGVARENASLRVRLAGYYRLAAADSTNRPFGLINSGNALFFGTDDGDYFRALGVELHGRAALTRPQTFAWRIYAERQRAVRNETDFSIPHLFDSGKRFRPNVVADSAEQVGAAAAFRGTRVFGAGAATVGADLWLDGAAGTFDFLRAALTLRATAPLPGPLTGGFEAAAGTSAGTLPAQSRWYLGGPSSLRGYDGGTAAGDEFWRARVEVANSFPAARLALFADAGRTAPRGGLTTRGALLGVGVGASFLDGLIRLDVARATRRPTGWRADFYLDGTI